MVPVKPAAFRAELLKTTLLLLAVKLLLFLAQRAPAPIYGLYPGLSSLEKQADSVLVVKLARRLPGEDNEFGYSHWELKILKSLRGPLEEGTTVAANLRFHHISAWDFGTTSPSAVSGTDADSNVKRLLLAGGRFSATEEGSVYLMFASHSAGLSLGSGPSDMHPLNGVEWSNLNLQGSLIRLSPDLPLATDPKAPVTSQVAEIVARVWEHFPQSAGGQ